MKLYLSSYRIGNNPSRMLLSSARNLRVGVIQNALDCYTDPHRREAALEREFTDLRSIDLSPEELDLREYFGKEEELQEKVATLSYLWIVGGNSFVLRRAFSQSGLDSILQRLNDDNFVYAGYSAGVCVLAPTLKGIHLADSPNAIAEGYSEEIIWEGLNVLPYCVAPHYKSNHPETELIDLSVAYFIENKIPFITLRDGEALVLDTKDIFNAFR